MGFVNKYYSTFQNIVAATWGEPHKFPFETSERSEKVTQPSGGCYHGSAHSVDGRASRVCEESCILCQELHLPRQEVLKSPK